MDLRDLQLNTNFYDIIIDKACIDILFCGENSFKNVELCLKNIFKVLK